MDKGSGSGEWLRGMGEWNGFRPVHCKGPPLQRLRRRNGRCVSVAVMEQMGISVCSICSIRPWLWMSRGWFAAMRDGAFGLW
jgi:hypothetical protein